MTLDPNDPNNWGEVGEPGKLWPFLEQRRVSMPEMISRVRRYPNGPCSGEAVADALIDAELLRRYLRAIEEWLDDFDPPNIIRGEN